MKKLFDYKIFNPDVLALMLRIIFGGLLVYHGYTKLIAFNEYHSYFPDLLGIGVKPSLILVIFAELICGTLVAIGFFTRLAAIPIFISMVTAYLIVHAQDAFDVKELSFLFLLLSIVVFTSGSGSLSLDHLIFKRK